MKTNIKKSELGKLLFQAAKEATECDLKDSSKYSTIKNLGLKKINKTEFFIEDLILNIFYFVLVDKNKFKNKKTKQEVLDTMYQEYYDFIAGIKSYRKRYGEYVDKLNIRFSEYDKALNNLKDEECLSALSEAILNNFHGKKVVNIKAIVYLSSCFVSSLESCNELLENLSIVD